MTVAGCTTTPTDPSRLFELTPESLQNRAMQTRVFETKDQTELLSASAAVLQDFGFQVEESVREVGFLRAAKERSAREYGQDIERLLVAILTVPLALFKAGPVIMPVDLHQQISATLIARPVNPEGTKHEVRVTFYRVVWKGGGAAGQNTIPPGAQSMEMLRDPVLYRQFFAKLSKAVFLEPYTL
jgi:hypothetical protein